MPSDDGTKSTDGNTNAVPVDNPANVDQKTNPPSNEVPNKSNDAKPDTVFRESSSDPTANDNSKGGDGCTERKIYKPKFRVKSYESFEGGSSDAESNASSEVKCNADSSSAPPQVSTTEPSNAAVPHPVAHPEPEPTRSRTQQEERRSYGNVMHPAWPTSHQNYQHPLHGVHYGGLVPRPPLATSPGGYVFRDRGEHDRDRRVEREDEDAPFDLSFKPASKDAPGRHGGDQRPDAAAARHRDTTGGHPSPYQVEKLLSKLPTFFVFPPLFHSIVFFFFLFGVVKFMECADAD